MGKEELLLCLFHRQQIQCELKYINFLFIKIFMSGFDIKSCNVFFFNQFSEIQISVVV